MKKCRSVRQKKRSVELCSEARVPQQGSQLNYFLSLRDPSKPQVRGTTDHPVLRETRLRLRRGERVLHKWVVDYELSPRISMIFVPIVDGGPKKNEGGRSVIYLWDHKTSKLKLEWNSAPCPKDCVKQDVQLRFRPGEKQKQIRFVQRAAGRSHTKKLLWDGKKIR